MDDLRDPVDPEDLLHHLYRQRTRLVSMDHGADDIPGENIDHHVRIEILALHRPGQLRYIPREHLPRAGGHQLGADPGRWPPARGGPGPGAGPTAAAPAPGSAHPGSGTSTTPSTGTCPRPAAGRRPATAAGPRTEASPAP